ncbi:ScbA/BarX family gamma-butyrolactone biosynthesis protein [Streptomyces sp. SID12488]|uniref:ScbA/BarX family gamma-butyrolactone biosynthesis protein n=1 Tax=Streptomyces sp. SID12488 TaxID=2706040 RepID=UPI0013D8F26C|nr:ScbA/BarX family gamma-butyrolactone biosynthesis protein [Streptomyces sp. SID12488]NEA65561.1 gamma-butyrolactone biosynthesis enzyme [Streptomyces sp. SID12488]
MPSPTRAPGTDTASPTGSLLTTTVPRGYVHRAAVAEVFLTGWEAAPTAHAAPTTASDSFVVRAQLPRGHALFAPAHGHQDPLLLLESIRQAGTLLSHAEYGVPFGHQFLMWGLSFAATPAALTTGATPTDVELHTVCHDIVRRGRTISGMRYDVSVRRDGVPVATGGASFGVTSPAVHRRLREGRPTVVDRALPTPVDPAEVGHTDPGNVLLAAPARTGANGRPNSRVSGGENRWANSWANRWELRVDTGHPILFDHPVDHVPGMLLIEAARQAARAATGRPDALLLGLDSNFTRYAELDAPCWMEARVARPDAFGPGRAQDLRVHVLATQQGERVFAADLVLRDPSA